MAQAFSYGAFNMNDGINYYVVGKDNPSFAPITQTYYKIGRLEGMKKTGEVVNQKTITVSMVIIGTSRSDLENKIDALQQALNLRGQNLTLHSNDGRYYSADCVDCQIQFQQGNVLYCAAKLTFVAINPWAVAAASSTSDTGTVALTLVSGTTYKIATRTIVGGGNVFARPIIRVYKRDATATAWSSVKITQNNDGQILTVSTGLPTTNGGYIDIYCDPGGSNGFSSVLNSTTTTGQVSGIFPVMEPFSQTWDVQITYAATGSFSAQVVWTWTPRWLS